MRRFLSEFVMAMKTRQHLFFLVLIWSVASVVLFASGVGIETSVDRAFSETSTGIKEYTYDLEIENQLVINSQAVELRQRINEMLTNTPSFSYYSYYETTARTSELACKALDVDSNGTEGIEKEKKTFTVRVLFIDEKAAALNPELKAVFAPMFTGNRDIDASIPAVLGSTWRREGFTLKEPTYNFDINMEGKGGESSVKSISRPLEPLQILDAGRTITLNGTVYNLDNYIILPLRDAGVSTSTDESITEQNRRAFWCKIYDIRNSGVISCRMTANTLQKELTEVIEKKGLTENITINVAGADYKNKLIFQADVYDTITAVKKVSYIALMIALILMLVYVYYSIDRNQKFEYIAYITGTSKMEFVLISVNQILVWFILTVVLGFGIYALVCRISSIAEVGMNTFMIPALIIAVICIVFASVRILRWDAGKSLRDI